MLDVKKKSQEIMQSILFYYYEKTLCPPQVRSLLTLKITSIYIVQQIKF